MCYVLRMPHPASTLSGDELRDYYGLNEAYWASMGPKEQALYLLIRPLPSNFYKVDVTVDGLRRWVDQTHSDQASMGGGLELNPDFQRGHVWTEEQRIAFCESFVRGQASALFLFNCPSYNERIRQGGDLHPEMVQCIDGLQRLTALMDFAADEVPVFGGSVASDLAGTAFSIKRLHTQVRVYSMRTRAELLGFYLDLNSGGTVHSKEELARVRSMLAAAQSASANPAPERKKARP